MIPGMRHWCFLLLLAGMALPVMGQSSAPANTQRTESALTIKTGELWLADDSQTLSGSDWGFDRSAVNVLAIEGETRLPKGAEDFSIGGEFLYFQNRYRRTSGTPPDEGKVSTRSFLAKSKYYFSRGEAFQPYAGLGFGVVLSDDYSGGPIREVADGNGYFGLVGVQMRAERVGFRVEYTGLRTRLTDNNGQKMNSSVHGILVGISFFLGRR
jgi:opacity protein-like surface antigen